MLYCCIQHVEETTTTASRHVAKLEHDQSASRQQIDEENILAKKNTNNRSNRHFGQRNKSKLSVNVEDSIAQPQIVRVGNESMYPSSPSIQVLIAELKRILSLCESIIPDIEKGLQLLNQILEGYDTPSMGSMGEKMAHDKMEEVHSLLSTLLSNEVVI